MDNKGELPDRFWIVVVEDDGVGGGPLVWETPCMTEAQADAQIGNIGGRYGWATKILVEPVQPTAVVPAE